MTNCERIVATLKCEETDRPPLINWLGTVAWEQTMERWRLESGQADLNLAEHFGYDRGFIEAPVELGPWPHFRRKMIDEDEETETYVDWRGITIRNRKDKNTLPYYVDSPVQTPEGWEHYKSERLSAEVAERVARLEGFADEISSVDAPVQVGRYPFGCFGTPRDILGVEHLLISYYDHPDLVHDIIDTHIDLWLRIYAEVAEKTQIDHIHIWEDMSGKQGSLISMEMVEEFMMPGYDRIAEFRSAREVAAFSVDTDGFVVELVEKMHAHGVNSFFPFEAQAGNDIVAVKKQYPDMSVWGGLDKRALASGRSAIHLELDKAQELFALGGYIAGFDHAIPPDVPWENFKYCMNAMRRIIGL